MTTKMTPCWKIKLNNKFPVDDYEIIAKMRNFALCKTTIKKY